MVGTDGAVLAANHVGEVQLRSPALMLGYFGDPEASAKIFDDGWLRTRDVGFVDGELVLLGRDKDVIIINGRNFYAYDIEEALSAVTSTRLGAAVAFAVAADEGERLILAVEVRTRDAAQLTIEVREACHVNVGVVPTEVVFVRLGSLPRTSSGKIRRGVVREQFESGTLGGVPARGAVANVPTDMAEAHAEAEVGVEVGA